MKKIKTKLEMKAGENDFPNSKLKSGWKDKFICLMLNGDSQSEYPAQQINRINTTELQQTKLSTCLLRIFFFFFIFQKKKRNISQTQVFHFDPVAFYNWKERKKKKPIQIEMFLFRWEFNQANRFFHMKCNPNENPFGMIIFSSI